MMLDVYVRGEKVGVLEQTDITSFVFSYLPDVSADQAVSLLMPPRTKSWESPFLFPVFQVSLPEGALRQTLEQSFAKHFDRFDDMALLSIVGESLIGQIQVVPPGQIPRQKTMQQSLESLLSEDLKSIVSYYLGKNSSGPGVSGGFLKFLARSPSKSREGVNRTMAINEWVVKLNDPDRPTIVLLEHFGMMAARKMGLPTAQTHLSEDFSRLLVRRFDIDDQGKALGFEDMCALTGQPARYKFSGSVERIIRSIDAFCPGLPGKKSVEQFYGQYLLSNTIRNGDAHLKNFGVLYGPDLSPRLAPVYDMLSMSVYAPARDSGDAMDALALTFGGTTRWLREAELRKLAMTCRVSASTQARYKARMTQALLDTAEQVLQFQQAQPHAGFGPQAARMLTLWSCGMAEVDRAVAPRFAEMARQVLDLHSEIR